MSTITEELRNSATAYRTAILTLGEIRLERELAKRDLKEVESIIFAEKVKLGTIDGKNAETRDAQAALAFKANTEWQAAFDRFIKAEAAFMSAQDGVTISLMELKVAATLVNVQIAETGASRLLSEVSLAGA